MSCSILRKHPYSYINNILSADYHVDTLCFISQYFSKVNSKANPSTILDIFREYKVVAGNMATIFCAKHSGLSFGGVGSSREAI